MNMNARVSACRALFVGAVQEGKSCLEGLLFRGEPICGIVTLKEEWARETSGAVPFDDLAAAHGVPLLKVRNLNHPKNVERVLAFAPDLILVIGWTRLLGREILAIPRLGAVGFHASLLPRYRGRAPVNWALINGEVETGNTMFFLDSGVDSGDIITQRAIRITSSDTCATLYARVAESATEMLKAMLPLIKAGSAPRDPQDHALATVMPKRTPADGVIDWAKDAVALDRWIRALTHPYPGAFTFVEGARLFVWEASVAPEPVTAEPGTITKIGSEGISVATGRGALRMRTVQIEGEIEGSAASVAASRRWTEGMRLRCALVG
jgi:methionyl-tRNA formyltransferase